MEYLRESIILSRVCLDFKFSRGRKMEVLEMLPFDSEEVKEMIGEGGG